MKIEADVQSISKLKDFFFLVPDYQREYVWKADDEVKQFLLDIENEYVPGARTQRSYFIGSVIIVNHKEKFEVVDGQQRLTTIMLMLCAFRDLLFRQEKDDKHAKYLELINDLLYNFDIESDETRVRLELQYEESHDFLSQKIKGREYGGDTTPSIDRMRQAYNHIMNHLGVYDNADKLVDFIKYYLTKIELVVIQAEDLSSALKIFETINQRGTGLNAMDLVKNLLFSHTKESDFAKIKDIWKDIIQNLQDCQEDSKPLRFLRYFLISRYYNDGILREDDLYKWIISADGKAAIGYEQKPLVFAQEIRAISKRYSDLIRSTESQKEGEIYPNVTNIGFINKYKSRQHLILLLSLGIQADKAAIEYLAQQIESFFFYSSTLRIQAKNNESLFGQWAKKLRGLTAIQDIAAAVDQTMVPYLTALLPRFKSEFSTLQHGVYNPLYRLKYILGRLENGILANCNKPLHNYDFFQNMQIEHIFPQTPKNAVIPSEFANEDEYYNYVFRLGNVSLLDSMTNQALNKCNDLSDNDWFVDKQSAYGRTSVYLTQLLDSNFSVGTDTALNRFRNDHHYTFSTWNKAAVEARQKILLDMVFDTWRINDKRLDKIKS